MTYLNHYASPLGQVTLASDGQSLIGLWFDGQAHFGSTITKGAVEQDLLVFAQTCKWLDLYFAGEAPDFTPPLRFLGTPFQKEVWNLLLTIPYGQTTTYGALALALARKQGRMSQSAQAVGGAVARNPISLIVPCHRVVGANGSLTGYAGGLEKKKWLLALEQPKE
ncbi:MAG: methylated-DNA--[Lachnospiraceae bacterium]|nr:methylated-DNA--[protein]-cysteine S-methyltransferase [Lachnospiraceae bacterium]